MNRFWKAFDSLSNVVFCIGLAAVLCAAAAKYGMPRAKAAVSSARIVGAWHVDGSFVDWRFGKDGSFIEEGLITHKGRFEVLDNDRIRISPGIGLSMIYKFKFDGRDLLLYGESGPVNFRLTAKG